MNDTLKKIAVSPEVLTKISGWLSAGRTVGRFVCQDLGCCAEWFSPEKLEHCQRHAWACPVSFDRNVTLTDLEVVPPRPEHKPGLPYRWEIIGLDVWGNAEDGWEVNNAFHTHKEIELPEDFKDKDVRDALVREGYLKKTCQTRHLEIEGDDTVLYVDETKNGYPLCQLHRAIGGLR